MNRDEKRTRVKGLPPALRHIKGRRVLYPSEPGGGTWIALNDQGVSFALINWYSATARAKGKTVSRGKVIPSISLAGAAGLVSAGLAGLQLDQINPFRLIGVFPASEEIIEWRWDLNQLSRMCHHWLAQQWISSSFDEPTAQKIRSETFRNARAKKSGGTIDWLRRLHRSHSPTTGPFSTCMHRADAATVSYTEIDVLGVSARLRHVCGPPCRRSGVIQYKMAVLPP